MGQIIAARVPPVKARARRRFELKILERRQLRRREAQGGPHLSLAGPVAGVVDLHPEAISD
jgi:hypothetical protein